MFIVHYPNSYTYVLDFMSQTLPPTQIPLISDFLKNHPLRPTFYSYVPILFCQLFFMSNTYLLLFLFPTISNIITENDTRFFFYIPTHMSRLGVQKRVPQASNQSYSFPLPTHEIQNHTPHLTNISTQFQVARANYLIIFILSIIYPKIIVNRSFFHSFLKIN